MERIVFDNLFDLARLPWFDLDGPERLVLADRAVGPVIDAHSHLALAYVRPMQVDLHREHPRTEHYLPACNAIDFEVYQNKNFTPAQLKALTHDLTWMSLTGRGMRATHTVPNLLREMRDLGVAHSVILPIDFPLGLSNNARTALTEARSTPLIAFGSVHPYTLDLARALDEQVALGARGIKMHPNVQTFRPDDPRAMKLYALCGARALPVLIHCGPVGIEPALGRYLTQVRFYERPIRENPRTSFILGHAGALQADAALDLQKRYGNVYLETSGQGVSTLRRFLTEGDPERVVYGSDWPFYHQALGIAKLLLATEGAEVALRRKVLHDNIARLLKLD